MIALDEALRLVLAAAAPLAVERVALDASVGRVAAEDAASVVDLPPFDRSAMDGFAVVAADTAAGEPLRLLGDVAAGGEAAEEVVPGVAAPISTGAPLPAGADAVLPVEIAEVRGETVVPLAAVDSGRHIRVRGEDVRRGDVLVRAGEPLTLPRISALAAAGVGAVAVHRRPRLHVLVTGSELLPPGAPPEPGRIHESNGLMLRLLAERAGAAVTDHGVVGDDRAATDTAIGAGLGGDVLVVSGGVSMGVHDHVRPAFAAAGVEELFWRVRIKPGKPLFFGRRGAALVFGLPGNPLSAIVGFAVFIDPALRRLAGEPDPRPRLERGRLTVAARADDGRTTFLTSTLRPGPDGVLEATPTARQGSHMTGALGESDGFAVAPADAGELPAGAPVDVLRL